MLRYDIVQLIDGSALRLTSFEVPWADSVPTFHKVASAVLAERSSQLADLQLFATDEGSADPRPVLVCTARATSYEPDLKIEILAGPLLLAAIRKSQH